MFYIWAGYAIFGVGLLFAQFLGFSGGDADQTLQTVLLSVILAKMSRDDT
jgi:hypothetical protein